MRTSRGDDADISGRRCGHLGETMRTSRGDDADISGRRCGHLRETPRSSRGDAADISGRRRGHLEETPRTSRGDAEVISGRRRGHLGETPRSSRASTPSSRASTPSSRASTSSSRASTPWVRRASGDRESQGGGAWRGGPPPRPQAGGRGQVVVGSSCTVTRDRESAGRSYEAPGCCLPVTRGPVERAGRRPRTDGDGPRQDSRRRSRPRGHT
jgi:hypothetical protein